MHRRTASGSIGTLSATARAAMRELLVRGPLPRAELARLLDLSPASLTKATRELLDRGLISAETVVRDETRGRPGVPLSIVAKRCQFLGIKVTGDAVFAIRVDALGGVRESRKRDLDSAEVNMVHHHIVELVNEMASDHPVQAVGIGLAGRMSRFDDHVRDNQYLDWDVVPLSSMVEDATGLPTVLSNDVRALTAGVQWWGPGRTWQNFAVVTIGVGIGLCPVIEGTVLAGPRGGVGMVGHHRVNDSGPVCEDGHRGCATAMLNSASIINAVATTHGRGMTLAEVCEHADRGDAAARRVLAEAGQALGAIIAEVTNMLDLQGIVVTGDGLPIIKHARGAMEETLTERIDAQAHLPVIELFSSDFDEWARGAAVVACQWLLLDPPGPARLRRSDIGTVPPHVATSAHEATASPA